MHHIHITCTSHAHHMHVTRSLPLLQMWHHLGLSTVATCERWHDEVHHTPNQHQTGSGNDEMGMKPQHSSAKCYKSKHPAIYFMYEKHQFHTHSFTDVLEKIFFNSQSFMCILCWALSLFVKQIKWIIALTSLYSLLAMSLSILSEWKLQPLYEAAILMTS